MFVLKIFGIQNKSESKIYIKTLLKPFFLNKKYTVFNLCFACINLISVFLIRETDFNRIKRTFLYTKHIS